MARVNEYLRINLSVIRLANQFDEIYIFVANAVCQHKTRATQGHAMFNNVQHRSCSRVHTENGANEWKGRERVCTKFDVMPNQIGGICRVLLWYYNQSIFSNAVAPATAHTLSLSLCTYKRSVEPVAKCFVQFWSLHFTICAAAVGSVLSKTYGKKRKRSRRRSIRRRRRRKKSNNTHITSGH